VHTVEGLDGGNSALVCTLSPVAAGSSFSETSIERASEPKHAADVPGNPTMLVVPAIRPFSSPYLSSSHLSEPAALPYGVFAHQAGLPCESLFRHCLTSSIAM
jgi:hypothetical protein